LVSSKRSHGETGRSAGSPKRSHGETGRSAGSPKDRFVTVYGRNPVIEVLDDPSLVVDKVVMAEGVRGHGIGEILGLARDRGVPVQRASAERVKKLAGNGRQDQGVFADVVAPRMRPLADALDDVSLRRVVLLDGVTTPANVGMILRTATAAGVDGIVVPRRGVASIDPLVVKASAGVAFRAPILKVGTAAEAASALAAAGFHLVGLAADGPASLFEAEWPSNVVFVLGSETAGVSADVAEQVRSWVSIPMAGGVESLNVAAAAAVVCFELVRRSPSGPS
jgi:23S rRNA (guanosine2251-2'-O)-methyltransferase